MLAETGLVAAIDVGTTKVCTIVGRKTESGGIRILGHSNVPSQGLRKGNVADVVATQAAIRESISRAERATGERIESAFVGVTGAHVTFENRRDTVTAQRENGVITARDLSRPTPALATHRDEPGRKLIHAIKMSYSLDGEDGIRNPLGMHADRFEVDTHIVTGGSSFINKLVAAVEGAGVKVASLVLEPLASGLAVLAAGEKESGALLVDIGGGTTDVVGFQHGRICYTGVIPVGGYQFTNDISITFNTPYEVAEDLKLTHATTDIDPMDYEEIAVPVDGQSRGMKVQRQEICQLARERARELARLVGLKYRDAAMGGPGEVRVVLTGGASNMPGLAELMKRSLGTHVRVGVPNGPSAVPEDLRDPSFATSVGIALWAATDYAGETAGAADGSGEASEDTPEGLLSRALRSLGRWAPFGLFGIGKGRADDI